MKILILGVLFLSSLSAIGGEVMTFNVSTGRLFAGTLSEVISVISQKIDLELKNRCEAGGSVLYIEVSIVAGNDTGDGNFSSPSGRATLSAVCN